MGLVRVTKCGLDNNSIDGQVKRNVFLLAFSTIFVCRSSGKVEPMVGQVSAYTRDTSEFYSRTTATTDVKSV